MDRTELRRMVDQMEVLPTLCSVAVQLLRLTNDETARASSIARVIESDQALTARLLRLVNSPGYGFTTEITTVSRAVVALGFNTIRSMALGMAVADLFPRNTHNGAFQLKEFWKHSLACAVCAEMIAGYSPKGELDKDEAFVAGLLHDIGKLVLSTCLKEEYDYLVQRAKEEDRSLLDIEQEVLGVGHAEAGKWLTERWGLPDAFAQVIWLHHQAPGAVEGHGFQQPLISTIHIADTIARSLMIGASGNCQYEPVDLAALQELGVSAEKATEIQATLCRRVEERASMINLDLDEQQLYLESLQKANLELARLSLRTEQQNRLLTRRARRFRALHEMNAQLGPGQTLGDVITILSKALRDGFDVSTGLCYIANGRTQSLKGKAWRDGGALRDFELALDSSLRPMTDTSSFDASIQAVLRETALQFRGDAWLGQGVVDVLRRQDLLVVPMVAERRSMGQFVIDLRHVQGWYDGEHALDEILAMAAAAGMALSRVYVNYALKQRSEELAAAMWKKEQAHKQLLHSERLAAVGKMAAGAAHEINNPLAIISGRAQMMLMQKDDGPADPKALEIIIDQCSRASKILSDLMGFARPALPRKEILNINGVIYETLGLFERRFEKRTITLKTEFGEHLPKVLVDKNQLQQVFVNLLINAEHAITPPGTITVSTELNKTGDRIQITFTDTGCGISPENLRRIFEPFFTTKKEGEGTGLGLSLAYGIIESHQGVITAKSKVGEGTSFTITLPIAEDVEAVAETSPARPTPAPRVKARRILIVDDEVHVRAIISEAMTAQGWLIEQAENGLDAIEKLQSSHYDLMTLDIRMPRMDGMALLRTVSERMPELPVIVITGLASDDEVRIAQGMGVRACIRKPFDVGNLLAEARKAIQQD